jgi:MFS family permease
MASRIESLQKNKRILFSVKFFLELKSLSGVVQLFYLSRGLSVSQIIYLSTLWAVTIILTDIPSSYLADKFGRKKLIIAGIAISSLALLSLFFVHGFIPMAITYIMSAAGYSFFIGADQAILYDSLKELKDEGSSSRVSGKYFSAASLPKIVTPLIGSFIAKGLLPWQFMVLIGIDFAGTLAAMTAAFRLTEPEKEEVKGGSRLKLIEDGIKTILENKVLIKLTMNKIFVFEGAFVFWKIYQIVLNGAGLPVVYLGLIYTIYQSIMFITLWNIDKVRNLVGEMTIFYLPHIIGLLSVVITIFTNNIVVLFCAVTLGISVGTIRDPLFLTQVQKRASSYNRATITSILGTIRDLADVPVLLLAGSLASLNVRYVLIMSAILFAVGLIFFPVKKKYLA